MAAELEIQANTQTHKYYAPARLNSMAHKIAQSCEQVSEQINDRTR